MLIVSCLLGQRIHSSVCASILAFRTACSQQVLLQLLSDWKQQHAEDLEVPCVHFIETEPSMLHEMPYVLHRDYKVCIFCMGVLNRN